MEAISVEGNLTWVANTIKTIQLPNKCKRSNKYFHCGIGELICADLTDTLKAANKLEIIS